jgi:hypothetical protein
MESGEAQKRSRYNPMRAVMSVARPAGKAIGYVPGMRAGLQQVSQSYRADVEKRASNLEKFRTEELMRRVGPTTLPVDRAAIAQVLSKRDDTNDMNVAQVKSAATLLKNTGFSTYKLETQRPDAFYDPNNPETMEKAFSKIKKADISKLHDVIVSSTDGDKKDKVDAKEIGDQLAQVILRTFDAGKLAKVIQEGSELSRIVIDRLMKESGEDKTRRSEGLIKYYTEKASKEKNEKYRKTQAGVAAYFKTTPAKRNLGLDDHDKDKDKSTSKSKGSSTQQDVGDGEDSNKHVPYSQQERTKGLKKDMQ